MNQSQLFTDQIDSHKNLILKVAGTYCFDTEDRKDLAQEIVLQLWKSFSNYNTSFKFSTWAYRIALNVSISYVRKTLVRNKAMAEYRNLVRVDIPEDTQPAIALQKLHLALEILKPIDKAIITLHLDGYSNKDIATIMGISPSNVGTRLLRIKNKLRTHLIA